MKKIFILTAFPLFVLIGYSAYFVTAQLPSLAQKQAQKTLQDMGFESVQLTEPDVRINAARFENITLDENGISTIKTIEIQYSPFSLLIMQQPSVVKIDGLYLVGELLNTQTVDIAGWNGANAKLNLQNGNLRRLVIQNGRLSLLTDDWGGINIDYSMQMRSRGKQVEIEGHLKSQQKHISMIASAKGFINRDGLWQADLEVSQGKFDIAPVKITRANGLIKITAPPGKTPTIIAELQAGGVNIYDFPWGNASGTFEGTPSAFKIFADMKSIGYEGQELGLNIQRHGGKTEISGAVQGENFESFNHYITRGDLNFFKAEALEPFKESANPILNLLIKDYPNSAMVYTLSNDGSTKKLSGQIPLPAQSPK